jgi:Tol biopolymer transport system component
MPAVSPDGESMAYLVRPVDANLADLVLMDLEGTNVRTVAREALPESVVRWSPDQRYLAYSRPTAAGIEIVKVHAESGATEIALALGGRDRRTSLVDSSFLDWGERGIAFSARQGLNSPYYISLLPNDSPAPLRITRPPESVTGDTAPVFSPDGRTIAFTRYQSLSECDLFTIDIQSGEERQLTDEHSRIWGLDWTPDGAGLVYSSSNGAGHPRLWLRPLGAESAVALTDPQTQAQYPSLAKHEDRTILAYQQKERWENVWQWTPEAGESQLIASTWFDAWPDLSPDGSRIAFISQRSGAHEVWLSVPGQPEVRLTNQGGPYTDMPRWSPDSSEIAFSSANQDGNRDIYIVEVQSRKTRRLTTSASEEGRASWSHDGHWVYFRSDRSGSPQIWKRLGKGGGDAIRITEHGGYEAFESLDGGTLFYVKSREQPELWSVPVNGGREGLILEGVREANWRVVRQGIVYWSRGRFILWNSKSGHFETLHERPRATPLFGLAVTPDATRLVWSQTDRNSSDIWLADFPAN